jgi:hypothetical protein
VSLDEDEEVSNWDGKVQTYAEPRVSENAYQTALGKVYWYDVEVLSVGGGAGYLVDGESPLVE